MKNSWFKKIACAAMVLSSASATAQSDQVRSAVQISGLTFSVFDMRPDDGVSPAFSLTGGSSVFHLSAQDMNGNVLIDRSADSDTVINPRVNVSAAHGSASAWSGMTSVGAALSYDVLAQPGEASVNSTTTWEFNLAPGTALLVTGTLDRSTFRLGKYYGTTRGGAVEVNGLATLGNEQSSEDNRLWEIWGNGYTGRHEMRWTLFNGDDRTVAGALSLEIQNSIYTRVIPGVPEPSSYLMLVTGGLLTAGAIRRRQRRKHI
jgi:hypothetical protein